MYSNNGFPSLSARVLFSFVNILSLFQTISGAYTCFDCTDAILTTECLSVRRCGPHETCYLDQYITAVGVSYNMGCRDTEFCGSGKREVDYTTSLERRASGDVLKCSECCDGHLCNNNLCGQTGLPELGPICYSCTQQLQPDSCDEIGQCGRDQVCQLERFESSTSHRTLYESKCAAKTECVQRLAIVQTIIGKRYSEEVTKESDLMIKCCDEHLCNDGPGETMTPAPTTAAPTTAATTTPAPTAALNTATVIVYDACLSNPCVYGHCSGNDTHFACACSDGYTGELCDQPDNHCSSSPCVYGSCFASSRGFLCTCEEGYTGERCEIADSNDVAFDSADVAHDHCSSGPCLHGACYSNEVSYICQCDVGFTGTECDRAEDHCSSNPCGDHGVCYDGLSSFKCVCDTGYASTLCDQLESSCKRDVVFLLDHSASIGLDTAKKSVRFVKEILRELNIGPDEVMTSVVTYSTNVIVEWDLNAFTTLTQMITALDNLVYTNGVTHILDALSVVISQVLTSSHGDRADADNVVLIFTDGGFNDPDAIVDVMDDQVKTIATDIFSIAMGNPGTTELENLRRIATDSTHLFDTSDIDNLTTHIPTIIEKICN